MTSKFKSYEAPLVDIVKVEVEQGFAVSADSKLPGVNIPGFDNEIDW